MKLGNFFEAAPHAKAVNPKPVHVICICKDAALPGGTDNPGGEGHQVKATALGCFIYLTSDETDEIRDQAETALRKRRVDKKTKFPKPISDDAIVRETRLYLLAQAIREHDPKRPAEAGTVLFEGGAKQLRKLTTDREQARLWVRWQEYIAEEHPEGLDAEPFRGAESGGVGVAVDASDGSGEAADDDEEEAG